MKVLPTAQAALKLLHDEIKGAPGWRVVGCRMLVAPLQDMLETGVWVPPPADAVPYVAGQEAAVIQHLISATAAAVPAGDKLQWIEVWII